MVKFGNFFVLVGFMPPLLSNYITKKRLQAIAQYLTGDILDLGCGFSRIPGYLLPEQQYVGVDHSLRTITWLESTFPHYEFYQRGNRCI